MKEIYIGRKTFNPLSQLTATVFNLTPGKEYDVYEGSFSPMQYMLISDTGRKRYPNIRHFIDSSTQKEPEMTIPDYLYQRDCDI